MTNDMNPFAVGNCEIQLRSDGDVFCSLGGVHHDVIGQLI